MCENPFKTELNTLHAARVRVPFAPSYGPTHSSHMHTPQEVGQIDQTSMRWRSIQTLNTRPSFFPSVIHVQVHLSEPVTVTCDWVVGEGDRLGDRMCPDIRLVMETGNLTGNTTTGKPAYPLFPTGFLFESKRENRPPDGSVLNFQYVVRLFDNVETLQYSGRDALQVMGTAAVSPGLHRPPVSDVVWGGPWGDLARAMVKERSAGRPWPPQPYREWVPNVEGVGFGDRFYGMNLEFEADARRWSGDASRNGGGDGYYVDHPAAEVPSATAPRPPVEGVSLVLPAIDDPRALHHQRKLRISTEWILPDQTVWDKPPYVK